MYQGVRMPQVIQEFVSQAFAFMSSWYQPCYVEELNGHGSFSLYACPVVWLTTIGEVISCACTRYLEIAYCSLRINGSEAVDISSDRLRILGLQLTESCLRLVVSHTPVPLFSQLHLPTFELASVKLQMLGSCQIQLDM